MREYYNINDKIEEGVKTALAAIANKGTSSKEYRKAFTELGRYLGIVISAEYPERGKTVVACPNEDADWLVAGLLNSLNDRDISLGVFWADRVMVSEEPKLEISPIITSYEEPMDSCETLIIAKSIINTSCVVRTQLTRLIGQIHPLRIIIAAPVMYKDAESNLRKEFPTDVASRFRFITFAVDDERKGNAVIPGIGGFITARLGLGTTMQDNNRYIPDIVKQRHMRFAK